MQTLSGTVENITFRNADTGFAVIRLCPDQPLPSGTLPVSCIGTLPTVEPGLSLTLVGDWETHAKFGRQFTVRSYEIRKPTTPDGILRLLSSGFIAHIGPGRAEKIVSLFGEKTLDILDTDPQKLRTIPGIGKKTLQKIVTSWQEQKYLRSLLLFLQEFGVTLNLAYRIFKAYGAAAQAKISENPYILVEDIWGVGFKRADAMARKAGFDKESYKRIHAGLTHVLNESTAEGHSFLPREELITRAAELLEVDKEKVTFSLDHAAGVKHCIQDGERIYLPLYYKAECAAGKDLCQRLSQSRPDPAFKEETFDQWLKEYSSRTGWQPDPLQRTACRTALQHNIFILTGGPGTGKTTTLQVIVSYFRDHERKICLAAPTGRAAQRMGSVAGMNALTIHRLLEFQPGSHGFTFARNAGNPLETDVVIIDETSMLDIALTGALLDAIPDHARIIFVGDRNQLPSVGAGNVLADLIESGSVPHVELTTIFRQATQSTIVTSAHQIIHGEVPRFANVAENNCFFIVEEDAALSLQTIVDLVTTRLPKRYNLDPVDDIQVLAPMHRGILGTLSINQALQKALNGSSRESVSRGETVFSVGDKVMQIQNNYDTDVFNGDIGRVTAIDNEDILTVDFDGRQVPYQNRFLDQLVHAYCISIHKSQGCEFKAVILPLATQHYVMLQRNLLYTAITRARQLCIIIGSHRALSLAVNNDKALSRYSYLKERIKRA